MINYKQYKKQQLNDEDIFTFDIETSSYWLTPSGVQGYTEEYAPDEYNGFPCGAVCYIWQFSINEKVYYGRELPDFVEFLKVVFSDYEGEFPIVWVHNLAYEWQFINEYLPINYESIFARTKRKPMKFKTKPIAGKDIEFRCSYFLTRLSLDAWGKELGFEKLHTLDYTILRTPKTKLKKKELEYCERDCLVLYKGIQDYIKKYGSQNTIPLTQTGEVRKEVKDKMVNDTYCKFITQQLPRTDEEYKLLKSVFQGGSCGGNYLYSGRVLSCVGSDDEQSAYPCQMVSQKYPMTRFVYCSPFDVKKTNFENWAFIIMLEFTNISSRTCLHYYSRHKAVAIKNGKFDNGKLIEASQLYCILTEQDLLIFEKCYQWEQIKIIKSYKAKKQYLPKEYIEIVLERYGYKTTLKGIEDKKEIYAQSKQFINSCYGMMVTDLVQNSVTFNGQEWKQEEGNTQERLNKLQRYRKKNFLSYSWGCWVTAYNRARLWLGGDWDEAGRPLGMLATPEKVVYYDTDSRKTFRDEEIVQILEEENRQNENRLKAMCKHYKIPFSKCAPKDPKGKKRMIGNWDFEGMYDNDGFIELGAKRYATKHDGQIEITVSGVPKVCADMITDLHQFKDGFYFDANHKNKETGLYDGKMLSIYCDGDNLQTTLNAGRYDEYKTTNKNSIVLRNNGYKLGLTSEYKMLILEGRERGYL